MSLNIHATANLDSPGLEPYRTLRRPLDHLHQGIFVAEGGRVVLRLLATNLPLISILLTPEWLERVRPLLEGRPEPTIDIFLAESRIVHSIVGYRLHQGIMAVARVPPEPSFDDLPASHTLVALDGLTQAENVGVIVRSCAAFGVDAIIAGETSCSPYLRRAVRNSMGGVFKLAVFHPADLGSTLAMLRDRHGTRLVAADAHAPSPLGTYHFGERVCIIAGNEDSGISPALLRLCDDRIKIPMRTGTDSLNVATALGVFLYELRRNRPGDHAQQTGFASALP